MVASGRGGSAGRSWARGVWTTLGVSALALGSCQCEERPDEILGAARDTDGGSSRGTTPAGAAAPQDPSDGGTSTDWIETPTPTDADAPPSACATAHGARPWPFGELNGTMEYGSMYGQFAKRPNEPASIHTALDLVHLPGTPVYAIETGEIVHVKLNEGSTANRVVIAPGGWESSGAPAILYLHLDYKDFQFAKVGTTVYEGDHIGNLVAWNPVEYTHLHLAMDGRDPVSRDPAITAKFPERVNPACYLGLRPDEVAPEFLDAAPDGPFAIFRHGTEDRFELAEGASLLEISGEVDVVARVIDRDRVCDEHPEPPFELVFEVEAADGGVLVPRRHLRLDRYIGNPKKETEHPYSIFVYYDAKVIYKDGLPLENEWTSRSGDYFMFLTKIPSDPASAQAWTHEEPWDTAEALDGAEAPVQATIRAWARDLAGNESCVEEWIVSIVGES